MIFPGVGKSGWIRTFIEYQKSSLKNNYHRKPEPQTGDMEKANEFYLKGILMIWPESQQILSVLFRLAGNSFFRPYRYFST
jgi:hypothetical protein